MVQAWTRQFVEKKFFFNLFDHNLIKRAQQMNSDARDDDAAIADERDFTRGLLAADDHCKNFRRSPWSSELHDGMTTNSSTCVTYPNF